MNLSLLAATLFLQYPSPQAACQVGQVIVDQAQHCCWPGQTWSDAGCLGQPQCPTGMVASGTVCLPAPPAQSACQAGQVLVDGEGHCCWPGQSWKRRGCHGKPHCPAGMVAARHGCAPAAAPAPSGYPASPGQAPSPVFSGYPVLQAPHAVVPVRFTAAKPEASYEIEVLDSGTPSCKTPCELRLAPNRYKLRVTGSARFTDRLTVAGQPLDLKVESGHGGWKALGVTSVAVGGAAFVGGAFTGMLVLLSTSMGYRETPYPADPYWARKRNEKLLICGGVSLAGAALAVAGGVIGFKRAGHTGISPVRAQPTPAPAPGAPPAPAPDPEEAPETEEPASGGREGVPALQLLGLGAAPTADGLQVGAVFAF